MISGLVKLNYSNTALKFIIFCHKLSKVRFGKEKIIFVTTQARTGDPVRVRYTVITVTLR